MTMTGKCGRLWEKRHWRRLTAVLAALWLSAAAAGEKPAAPAKPDPARQAFGNRRIVCGVLNFILFYFTLDMMA